MELMGKVYRIFRERIWEDSSFDAHLKRQVMRQLNSAILEAQREIYEEVTKDDP